MKPIIKEILIILLLCCAICLVLGIIFYDYLPTNKVVPSKVEAYTTPNSIKDEIGKNYENQNNVWTQNLDIKSSDLELYRQEKSYDSGKANPFAASAEETTNPSTDNTTDNSSTGNSGSQTSNPDSTDHFFNSTGLK